MIIIIWRSFNFSIIIGQNIEKYVSFFISTEGLIRKRYNRANINFIYLILFIVWAIFLVLLCINSVKNKPNHSVAAYIFGIAMIVFVIFDIILIRRKQKHQLSSKGLIIARVITLCIWFATMYIALAYTPTDLFGVIYLGSIIRFYLFAIMYYPFYRVFHSFKNEA